MHFQYIVHSIEIRRGGVGNGLFIHILSSSTVSGGIDLNQKAVQFIPVFFLSRRELQYEDTSASVKASGGGGGRVLSV